MSYYNYSPPARFISWVFFLTTLPENAFLVVVLFFVEAAMNTSLFLGSFLVVFIVLLLAFFNNFPLSLVGILFALVVTLYINTIIFVVIGIFREAKDKDNKNNNSKE